MSSKIRLILVLILIAGGLALFNPGLEEFNAYIQKQMDLAPAPDAEGKKVRDFVAGIPAEALAGALEGGVVRKDYGVCSIFEIASEKDKKVFKILGFAKKVFVPLNKNPKTEDVKGEF